MSLPAVTPDPLADLLRRAGAGDPAALTDLLRRYERRLLAAARSFLRPHQRHALDSVDLVQSVHRALLPGLRAGRYAFTSDEQLVGLAVTVLRHKVLRSARRATLVAPRPPTADPAPDEQAMAREMMTRLVSELTPDDRRLVELRADDWATPDIAAHLGLTAAVVRARLSRLRRRLRDLGYPS